MAFIYYLTNYFVIEVNSVKLKVSYLEGCPINDKPATGIKNFAEIGHTHITNEVPDATPANGNGQTESSLCILVDSDMVCRIMSHCNSTDKNITQQTNAG